LYVRAHGGAAPQLAETIAASKIVHPVNATRHWRKVELSMASHAKA
jgi:hypothetical protein